MRSFMFMAAIGSLTVGASAGISNSVTFDYETWSSAPAKMSLYPGSWMTSIVNEDFTTVAAGSSMSISGGHDWNSWTATADSGEVIGDPSGTGSVRTADVATTLIFTFDHMLVGEVSGLHGIGGGFGLRSMSGVWVPGTLFIVLSDGTASEIAISKPGDFIGFWTDASVTISSLTIRAADQSSLKYQVTADNLAFGFAGVPAPGALALLAVAGVVGGRRRR